MFSQEERGRAVELYCSTSMTTQQVVEYLGYPTRQCLERWLQEDPRESPSRLSPLSKRVRAVRLCLRGLQQQVAAARLGVSAVLVWCIIGWRCIVQGGMAALQPKRGTTVTRNEKPGILPVPDDVGELHRRIEELELENALMRQVVDVAEERPGRQPEAPFEPGEDPAGPPAAPDVFT